MSDPVRLADLLDTERLDHLVEAGLVRRRSHPGGDLVVYDYTDEASRLRAWDHETRTCRGLITDGDGVVVARPFPKFFSLEEHAADPALGPVPSGCPEAITEKVDGSLGILYGEGAGAAVCTRGSFTSAQAVWATSHFRRRYGDVPRRAGATYLFEIVYPDNRLVVDYGGFTGLVLLAVIDTATGADLALPADWPGPVVSPADGLATLEDARRQAEAAPPGTGLRTEGWVVRFAAPAGCPNPRVKVKLADYVRLHRLLTGVTPRTIWQHLAEDRPLDPLVDAVPAEFAGWVERTAGELRAAYARVEAEHQALLATAPAERPAAAEHFRRCGGDGAVLFKMLDGLAYDRLIWRGLRPPPGGGYLDDPGA